MLFWVRLAKADNVHTNQKVKSILTMLKMNENSVIRRVLVCRINAYMKDVDQTSKNAHNSPIFDILNACHRFGMLNLVLQLVNGVTPIPK